MNRANFKINWNFTLKFWKKRSICSKLRCILFLIFHNIKFLEKAQNRNFASDPVWWHFLLFFTPSTVSQSFSAHLRFYMKQLSFFTWRKYIWSYSCALLKLVHREGHEIVDSWFAGWWSRCPRKWYGFPWRIYQNKRSEFISLFVDGVLKFVDLAR